MKISNPNQLYINEAIYNNGYADLINMLDAGISPSALIASDGTSAITSAVVGFQDVLLDRLLLKINHDFELSDFKILCIAIQNGNVYAFNKLIKEDLFLKNINYQGNLDNNTILHLSCFYGMDEITEKLLSLGSNVNIKNIYNKKPVEYFILNSNSSIILEKFIQAGIDLNDKNEFGFSLLDIIKSKLLQLSKYENGKDIVRVLNKNDIFI